MRSGLNIVALAVNFNDMPMIGNTTHVRSPSHEKVVGGCDAPMMVVDPIYQTHKDLNSTPRIHSNANSSFDAALLSATDD